MPEHPALTPAEWKIMHIVWQLQRCAARDVSERAAAEHGMAPSTVKTYLRRLVDTDQVQALAPDDSGGIRYAVEGFHIAFDADEGYEAALWDHFQAVSRTMCRKLRIGQHQARLHDVIGGTTFTFDLPSDHPLHEELQGFLSRTRQQMDRWLAQVEALPPRAEEERWVRVTLYTGQMVEELDEA